MLRAGIDIGSTWTKAVVMDTQDHILYQKILPTGWDSAGTALLIREEIERELSPDVHYVATGYGRVSVPFAERAVTEITCHGRGAAYLFGNEPSLVIDIGGQDTKVILLQGGQVRDFVMNDKCSAGTGRFLDVMASTLGDTVEGLCALAAQGSGIQISSMCTVFAESEIISLIGRGTPRADIAYGVIESITGKVYQLALKLSSPGQKVYLTGGLCELDYILSRLSAKLSCEVISSPLGRFAGAIGAALMLPVPSAP